MYNRFLIITGMLLVSFSTIAQDFAAQWQTLSGSDDTTAQAALLAGWERAAPKDAELYVAYFNYYLRRSKSEHISVGTVSTTQGGFTLTDSAGNVVGTLGSEVQYNPALLRQAIGYLDRGIRLHPQRLDMRFGKIYMLGETAQYENFTNEIVTTIDYGYGIQHRWLWKEGKPKTDAKAFFLTAMQDYVHTLYNTENDSLLPLMRRISEAVLKYDPAHVESLSNIALTYLIPGDNNKALVYLLKAEAAAPKDIIVLNNIAQAYVRKGDKTAARDYFQKIVKLGNPEEAAEALERLKKL